MRHTHTPSEWAAFLSLGVSFWAAGAAVVWLFADADLEDFDPRPALRRAGQTVHQVLVYVGHDLNRVVALVLHEARAAWTQTALTVASLLLLTVPTEVQGR